jgi:protein CpxP
MFKNYLLALTLAGLAATVAPSAIAQNNGTNNGASTNGSTDQQTAPATTGKRGHRGADFDPAKRTQKLTSKLKLTPDQQSKVQDILKSEQSQMQTLRADTSMSREERRPKMMEISKTSDSQVRSLLDPGQQKKFDTMQAKRDRKYGHRHGGQSAPATAPDSDQK